MTYPEYIKFYGLEETEATREDWIHNEWNHGRVYQHKGEFFSTTTGKKVF